MASPRALSALLLAASCSSGPAEPVAPTVSVDGVAASSVSGSPANLAAPATAAAPSPPASASLEDLRGAWRAISSPPGFLSYRFAGDSYLTDGHPAWQESGRLELLEADGKRLRLRFVDRIYDGKPDDDEERWLVLADDGRSFVMAGRTFERLDHEATVATDAPSPDSEPAAATPSSGP